RFFHGVKIAHINEAELESPTSEDFAQQSRCSVVRIHVRKNVIARRQRLKNGHARSSTGSKSCRRGAAFERADPLFQRLTVWIVVARVHEPARVGSFDISLESG